jgi:hypothetical protein
MILVLVAVVSSGLDPVYGNGSSLSVEDPTTHLNMIQVNVGGSFGVEIWIRNLPTPMVSFSFHLKWDPTMMQYVSHTPYPPSGLTWSIDVDTANVNSGLLEVHGGAEEGSEYSTDHMWLSVAFLCLRAGTSDLELNLAPPYAPSWFNGDMTLSFDTILDATVSQTGGSSPVGGEVIPINKLLILLPYLALIGTGVALSVPIVRKRKSS